MSLPTKNNRYAERKQLDEQIASKPPLPNPEIAADVKPLPVEDHLTQLRKPVALAGVVENGVVRLLDPEVKLRERSPVIVVAQH